MTNGKLFTKDFTLVVVGQIISLFGNAILRFALPLYLLRQTGSPTLFGIVSACSFLPLIFMSLVGGVLADRLNKRNIMVVLDLTTAGVILAYYLLNGILPLVPLIIVFLMLLYGISGTYQPAVQASIPVLLDRALITKGNSIINSVSTLAGSARSRDRRLAVRALGACSHFDDRRRLFRRVFGHGDLYPYPV